MAKRDEIKSIAEQIAGFDSLNSKLKFLKTDIEIFDAFMAGEKDINIPDIGLPIGKIIGISGKNGIGKSTLMMEISKRVCLKGFKVIYLDVEKGLNIKSLRDYGLLEFAAYDSAIESETSDEKLKEIRMQCLEDFLSGKKTFYCPSPRSYNQVLSTIKYLLDHNKGPEIKLLVIDSIKDIMSTKVLEEEGETEEFQMMIDAKSQEYFLLKLKSNLAFKDVCCVILNQVRIKVAGAVFYDGEAGGNGWMHRTDIRLFVKEHKKIEQMVINNNGEKEIKKIGNWIEIEIKKGRFGNSFSKLYMPLIFGKGFSNFILFNERLTEQGIIKKTGSWYEFNIPEYNIHEKYQGESGGYKIIKEHFDDIKKYIIDNKLLFVEKNVENNQE
jgi:RecA/RadA recombinase